MQRIQSPLQGRTTVKGNKMNEEAIEEYALKKALDIFCRHHLKTIFLQNNKHTNADPDEYYYYCLEEAGQRCTEWKHDKFNDF